MYVLDTNVVSELRKVRPGKAGGHVANWADSVDAGDLYLSVMTIHELEIGACCRNAAIRRGERSFGSG